MKKPKVLFTTEFTGLHTGYANYYRELMTELQKRGKYELAELASYCRANDPEHQQMIQGIPWKVFSVMPTNPAEEQEYRNNPVNEFGAYKFEAACLEFQPDIVCDIRDGWMASFIDQSPYRRFYKTVFMPTVDAESQSAEWLDLYQRTDYILSYTEFGDKILKEEGGGTINCRGIASPTVDSSVFKFIENKRAHKASMGVDPDSIIIGMVARNQRRKLYPALAESFVKFLNELNLQDTKNVFLYFHTAHPDLGFDIPDLVKQNGLSHKILFTLFCRNCKLSFPSFYRDVRTTCPRCRQSSVSFANSQTGVTREELAATYGLMDLYVQYCSNEGFGIPNVEAAMCGIPVAGTNYSGTESVIKNVGGKAIPVKLLFVEAETNRKLAFPDNDAMAAYIKEFVGLPETIRARMGYNTHLKAKQWYGSWENVAKTWSDIFDEVETREANQWVSPPDYIPVESLPPCPDHTKMTDEQFVMWAMTEILHRPDWSNTFLGLKMLRDIIYGNTSKGQLGFMSNDASMLGSRPNWEMVDRPKMYDYIKGLRNKFNQWEMARWNYIQDGRIK